MENGVTGLLPAEGVVHMDFDVHSADEMKNLLQKIPVEALADQMVDLELQYLGYDQMD